MVNLLGPTQGKPRRATSGFRFPIMGGNSWTADYQRNLKLYKTMFLLEMGFYLEDSIFLCQYLWTLQRDFVKPVEFEWITKNSNVQKLQGMEPLIKPWKIKSRASYSLGFSRHLTEKKLQMWRGSYPFCMIHMSLVGGVILDFGTLNPLLTNIVIFICYLLRWCLFLFLLFPLYGR